MLARRGFVSRIHRNKPPGRPMPERMRIANAQKSEVRSAVEHVFAHQKGPIGLIVRTNRHSPRQGEKRHGQSGLQHAPVRLAEDEMPSCITEKVSRRPQICADRKSRNWSNRRPPRANHGCAAPRSGYWRRPLIPSYCQDSPRCEEDDPGQAVNRPLIQSAEASMATSGKPGSCSS